MQGQILRTKESLSLVICQAIKLSGMVFLKENRSWLTSEQALNRLRGQTFAYAKAGACSHNLSGASG